MHDQKIKAATTIPPAVKPAPRQTSAAAAELLRSATLLPGGIPAGVQEALANLEKAKEAERLARDASRKPPPPPVAPQAPVGDNGDMEARLIAIEAVLPTLATKNDVAELRTDVHKLVGETHKWMLATVIGLFLGFGGLFLAMSNALKPAPAATAQAPAQAPIIINVPAAPPVPPTKP